MSNYSKHGSFKAFQTAASIMIEQYMAQDTARSLKALREKILASKESPELRLDAEAQV